MFVQPYLFFNGRCEEAVKFYGQTLGAEVTMMMRFGESPDPQSKVNMAPGTKDKIMHANVQIRDTQIMVSDGRCTGTSQFYGFALTLNAKDVADAEKLYAALGEGGTPHAPLTETFFAERFGMTTDKFGVLWMIIAEKK
jgi:PhnB protein